MRPGGSGGPHGHSQSHPGFRVTVTRGLQGSGAASWALMLMRCFGSCGTLALPPSSFRPLNKPCTSSETLKSPGGVEVFGVRHESFYLGLRLEPPTKLPLKSLELSSYSIVSDFPRRQGRIFIQFIQHPREVMKATLVSLLNCLCRTTRTEPATWR